jgi:hypothetical protein
MVKYIYRFCEVGCMGHAFATKPCVLFLMGTTKSGLRSASDGRKRETLAMDVCLASKAKGDTHYGGASRILSTC